MTSNTNNYATSKKAGQPQEEHQSCRLWKETTTPELMIWLGIIVYMSIVKLM